MISWGTNPTIHYIFSPTASTPSRLPWSLFHQSLSSTAAVPQRFLRQPTLHRNLFPRHYIIPPSSPPNPNPP